MDQKIYEEEQTHLSEVYERLRRMNEELEKRIENLNATAAEEKKDIMTNLRYDEADDEVLLESYGEIETWNRYIDTYNIRSEVLSSRLKNVKLLLASPYFARVTLQYEDEEDETPEDYYIGRSGVSDEHHEPIVLDWRSPIAETYYNQAIGETHYEVDGRRIPVNLLLRRQYDIEHDRLNAYFDTSMAIEDPLLIQTLSRRHSDKMQDITVTIQKEQNAVIRHRDVPVMLVSGIAGSGKTSVLLQRIAWLFYQKRETLRPENVYLLTLNPVFRQYIDDVLPDLGEKNPVTLTWMEFLRMVHCPIEDPGLMTMAQSLRRIDEELPNLRLTAEDLRPIKTRQGKKKRTVFRREQVLEILHRYDDRFPLGVRLVQVTASELEEEARKELRRKKWKKPDNGETSLWEDEEEDEILPADTSRSIGTRANDRFGHYYSQEEDALRSAADSSDADAGEHDGRTGPASDASTGSGGSGAGKNWNDNSAGSAVGRNGTGTEGGHSAPTRGEENEMQTRFSGTFQMIRDCEWLDINHIGQRLLGKEKLTSIEWLYLKMALTGECERNAQYVCIDEIQDYTLAQLMVLSRYFVNARFLLLGDEYQAIRSDTASFAQIHDLFDMHKRRVTEFTLDTSYRATPEITALFAGLLPPERRLNAVSVRREGSAPDIRVLPTDTALADALREKLGMDATGKKPSGNPAKAQASSPSPSTAQGLSPAAANAGLTTAQAEDPTGNPSPSSKAPLSAPFNIGTETERESAGLTAMICSNKSSLKHIQRLLGNNAPDVVGGDVPLPKEGAFLITLANAKGLEFDRVILPDVTAKEYPDDELSRHRLYTAISRATQHITILASGRLTPLLRTAAEDPS